MIPGLNEVLNGGHFGDLSFCFLEKVGQRVWLSRDKVTHWSRIATCSSEIFSRCSRCLLRHVGVESETKCDDNHNGLEHNKISRSLICQHFEDALLSAETFNIGTTFERIDVRKLNALAIGIYAETKRQSC